MTKSGLIGLIALVLIQTSLCTKLLKDSTGTVTLKYAPTSDGVNVYLIKNGTVQLSGTFGKGINFEGVSCLGNSVCQVNDIVVSINPVQNGFNFTTSSDNVLVVLEDCFSLMQSENVHWFGGPQRYNQVPLEKMTIDGSLPYVVRRDDNFGVAERYWLNSNGAYVFFDDINPLWVNQTLSGNGTVCFKANASSPYINRWRVTLSYVMFAEDDSKTAHLHAVNNYLGKPLRHPNDKMITEPIWTTWAKYKKPINDSTVLAFGEEIRSHGYEGGQLEIDDLWERCYGSQVFDESKFSDINNTISKLHDDNWRVSLWIHPFVDNDCQNNSQIGQELGYFVRNMTNDTRATWWNSEDAHQIDFTNAAAAKWFGDRVQSLKQIGIDSFKFDAGESDYMNQAPVYADVENSPNVLNQKYIDTCVEFGDLIEVRASFRGQQHGEFIRMLDKDSNWGLQNGLATLITTLLQLNMNGYVMVLPDMIGGNGYLGQNPTGDLIVRWTQVNAFMPAMQFSYLPWDYKDQVDYDIEAIVKKYVDLHAQYAPNIIKAMNKSIEDGSPVNPPIWWIDPTDNDAMAVSDEFLLGEEILVAPVIVENSTVRDIYLPKGQWKDGNNGTLYEGPVTLRSYYAPIDVLPYFILQ